MSFKLFAMKALTVAFCVLSLSQIGFSQDIDPGLQYKKKNRFYASWGYNRGWYAKSDIRFQGKNYDFTLKDVVASDRPSVFTVEEYFSPDNVTVPQYNCRIGYFFHEKYDLSIGIDHMKYVMQQNQTVSISGSISDTDILYDGTYNNEDIVLRRRFLQYEHTDGLNFANVELRRWEKILSVNNVELNFFQGAGVSMITPRSDITLLNFDNYDVFHLSGYGLSGILGVNLTFFNHFFLQTEWKGGFVGLPKVRTTSSKSDKASQNIWFSQWNFSFGSSFRVFN